MYYERSLTLSDYFDSNLDPLLLAASQSSQITKERTGLVFDKDSNVFLRIAFPLVFEGYYDLSRINSIPLGMQISLRLIKREEKLYGGIVDHEDSICFPYRIQLRTKPSFRIGISGVEERSPRHFWQVDHYMPFNSDDEGIEKLVSEIGGLTQLANSFFTLMTNYSKFHLTQREFSFL